MSDSVDHTQLEEQIGQWRAYLNRRHVAAAADVDLREADLRSQVGVLTQTGLAADEAFLVAVKRMVARDGASQAFARDQADRLWKQLVLPRDAAAAPVSHTETLVVFVLAAAAAAAVKVPALFGLRMGGAETFYARNLSLFVLPFLTGYFVWKRRPHLRHYLPLGIAFIAAAAVVNMYPFVRRSNTEMLSVFHLPIALWLVVGLAYVGGRWFEGDGRMEFVRFSGELFIYYVLIALGGGVLTAFTLMMFEAIGIKAQWLAGEWLIPCGAMGAVLVGSWLVEAKQSVVGNIAPMLTRLFTPLFTFVLLVFLGTMAWTGRPIDIQRNVLIAFDVLLGLVVALVLYAVSARPADARAGLFDGLQLLLMICALVVDAFALAAIAARISEFGFTPNRAAALGENLVLLVSLVGSAWLYAAFLRGRRSFHSLEAWQVAYLPVYSIWAAVVVVLFPPLFAYA